MTTNITILTFIKQECACYVSNECLGIEVFGRGFREQGKCYIAERKPCDYFIRCVLPIANKMGCYDRIMKEYHDFDPTIQKTSTRFCECGTELSKRERCCLRCRKKRRQKTKREYQRFYRGST